MCLKLYQNEWKQLIHLKYIELKNFYQKIRGLNATVSTV